MSDTDSIEPRPEEDTRVGTGEEVGSAPEPIREEEEAQSSPREKKAVSIASPEPTQEERERRKRK